MAATRTRANRPPVAYFGAPRLTRLLTDWADRPGGMSTQLAAALRHLVVAGELPAGARLPSERTLAAALGVARMTVAQAFDVLRADGVLVSRTGAGTFVSATAEHAAARGDDRLRSFAQAHASTSIDLRSAALPGLPMVAEELARLSAGDFAATLPTHGYVPGGLPELRAAVADYYAALGLPTEPAQVLVTSGAQQALRLLAEALVEPGGTVVVEEPTFRGAIEVLRAQGARLVGVPSGAHGVDVQALARAVRTYRPTFALLQTTVHNPTGSVLPEPARAQLARLSSDEGLPIVDDSAPADALVDGPLPRPLAAYGGTVLLVGSASKGFWGGLRVGWLRADVQTVERLTVVKGAEDLGTSLPAQVVVTRLLARADEARAERRAALAASRTAALGALANQLPAWHPLPPQGGASLWTKLPDGVSSTAFAERAKRAGVDVLPGPTFSCRDGLDSYLRIAFAEPPDVVRAGVERLAEAWRSWAGR